MDLRGGNALMRGFEDVTLGWLGEEYTVPADQQLMLIAKLEDALSDEGGHSAIAALMQPGGPSTARLARAYGAALRYAGAKVTDNEIYLRIEDSITTTGGDLHVAVNGYIMGLLAIMSPNTTSKIMALTDAGSDEKKTPETDTA